MEKKHIDSTLLLSLLIIIVCSSVKTMDAHPKTTTFPKQRSFRTENRLLAENRKLEKNNEDYIQEILELKKEIAITALATAKKTNFLERVKIKAKTLEAIIEILKKQLKQETVKVNQLTKKNEYFELLHHQGECIDILHQSMIDIKELEIFFPFFVFLDDRPRPSLFTPVLKENFLMIPMRTAPSQLVNPMVPSIIQKILKSPIFSFLTKPFSINQSKSERKFGL